MSHSSAPPAASTARTLSLYWSATRDSNTRRAGPLTASSTCLAASRLTQCYPKSTCQCCLSSALKFRLGLCLDRDFGHWQEPNLT